MNTSRKGIWIAALGMSLATMLWACGPGFPNWLLDGGEQGLLRSPKAVFAWELERLNGSRTSAFKMVVTTNDHSTDTLEAEMAELGGALEQAGTAAAQRQQILSAYETERGRLNRLRSQIEESRAWTVGQRSEATPNWEQPKVPEGVPREFADYLQGAIAFVSGNTNEARAAWQRVLELPAERRHFRSVWAAFMLGKLTVDSDPAAASIHFQQARSLAQDGFADRLGLAASSLGWEARAALKLKEHVRAIDLYLEQASAGALDSRSLRLVAADASEQDAATLQTLAAHQPSRRVMTAYFISNFEPYVEQPKLTHSRKWLTALREAGVVEPKAADQFALIAYQAGEFELAGQWLAIAPPDSIAALWLNAKLELRDGDLESAAALLSEAVRILPMSDSRQPVRPSLNLAESLKISGDRADQRMRGELGVLLLQRREYVEALDVMLRAGYWVDAAFVADRVLTLDELKVYVDRNWSGAVTKPEANEWEIDPDQRQQIDIRHLLARRLVRANRSAEALDYAPEGLRIPLAQLTRNLRIAGDESQTADVRAGAYWQAAKTTRHLGMELFGTALEPDWQIYDGSFDYGGPTSGTRSAIPEASPLHPLDEETRRVADAAPGSNHRFHYRYLAAELGWKAAELMPDQSDATASVLCEAGGWLKARDPVYADRFYKALVIRCGGTELGTAADRKRWFPQMDENGRLDEAMPLPVPTTYSGSWPEDEER